MSQPSFKDHFSTNAAAYATFRPHYPVALFDYVASLAPRRALVWDCATGNGQAAVPLADKFDRVVATDGSAEQISHATPHPRVTYSVALADASGLNDGCADLVTVAQALHWFPRERFFAEVRRVAAPDGVLAVWCYMKPTFGGGAIEQTFDQYYSGTCKPYWSPDRALVDSGYSTIEMPFKEFETPSFVIESELSLDDFGGYVRTWSATKSLAKAIGRDPVVELVEELRADWGPDARRIVRWPIRVRACRVHDA
jgi:SAM-dependent methyltransferase